MSLLLAAAGLLLAVTLLVTAFPAFHAAVERARPVRPTREGLALFFREWAVHALTALLLPFGVGQRPPRPSTAEGSGEVPVIVVPGYALNRAIAAPLAGWLRRRGWRWAWPLTLTPRSAPVPAYARLLARRVDELLRVSGADRVDIVGHSMGGIVAAWYVNRLGGADRVRRLVTLGTPWRGTPVAAFAFRRQGRDLLPGSEVVEAATPPAVPTVAIRSTGDWMVGLERAAAGGMEVVTIEGVGHIELLFHVRAFRAVRDALLGEPAGGSGTPATGEE